MRKYTYVFEILLSFVILDFFNYIVFSHTLGFLGAKVHPYWFVIFFMATRYGLAAGFISGCLSALHILYFSLMALPTRLGVEQVAETHGLGLPLAFVFIGSFWGHIIQKYKDRETENTKILEEQKETTTFLKQRIEAEERARRLLEARIVGETTTIKTLYGAAQRFDVSDMDGIYQGCLDILKEYLQIEKSSIYVRQGPYLVLKASSGWSSAQRLEGKISLESSIMRIALRENKLMTIKDIDQQGQDDEGKFEGADILAMIPVKDHQGNVKGIVNIEKIDFLLFNQPNLELMQLIVDWAARALEDRRLYDIVRSKSIFDETYQIYSYNYFTHTLQKEFSKARYANLPLTLSFIKLEKFGFFDEPAQELLTHTLLAHLRKATSDFDMIFLYKFKGAFMVVSPLKKEKEVQSMFKEFKKEFAKSFSAGKQKVNRCDVLISSTSMNKGIDNIADMINGVLEQCQVPFF